VSEGEGGGRGRTWTRQEGEGEGRERKKRSGSGTQQQPNLELQHLIIYQWKVRHILPKNIFHSIQCTVSILTLQKLIQFLTEF
jgi:hypothetical protein